MKRRKTVKRYTKHNNHKKIFRGALLIVILIGVLFCAIKLEFPREAADDTYSESVSASKVMIRAYDVDHSDEPVWNYSKEFDDIQELQLPAARALGVGPLTEDTIVYMLADGRLKQVRDSNATFYLHQVDYPYLVPEAKHTLEYIAEMYQKRVGDPNDRLRVTSLARTISHIKRLRRGNINAVEESCHLYGTTFDISYRDLNPVQKQALARVLRDLRDAGYCYVKYERKQPCFHITVRK